MTKEEEQLRKRYIELSNLAYSREIPFYTDFLNLNELNILHTTPKDQFPVCYRTFGGYMEAERQMAAFLPDAFSMYLEEPDIKAGYPMRVVKISPRGQKFAEALSHRDYLGAILNLGIERSQIGDILADEVGAYIFMKDKMAAVIIDELVRVKHTPVTVSEAAIAEISYSPKIEKITGSIASVRLDTLISLCYKLSRSRANEVIESARVFVNGKLVVNNGHKPKQGDIISVRGAGRFRFSKELNESKKGRLFVEIEKYI